MRPKSIPFHKFTSYGNNFLIIDESKRQYLTEIEKAEFACQATNVNFGVGADGVIFLQSCRKNIFAEINSIRKYWGILPNNPKIEFIFRLFEPNGIESFSCGNGLMCVANYFNRRYDIHSKKILTQIPTVQPKAITIGTNIEQETSWADMGKPHRVPEGIVNSSNTKIFNEEIEILDDVKITFREHDLRPFSNETSLILRGYLVYTGEPHFVILVDTGISIEILKNLLISSSNKSANTINKFERRTVFGSWLIHHIGTYLNRHYRAVFPHGINVDFAKISGQNEVIEYRCYERGINKETLACGTGALAVSVIARRLKLIRSKTISVWPNRCRWYDSDASIYVEEKKTGWTITGRPKILLQGNYYFNESAINKTKIIYLDKKNNHKNDQSNREFNYEHVIEY